MKNIVLVARDAGPSQSFEVIARGIEAAGHCATCFLGHGKPLPDLYAMDEAVGKADAIMVGISSKAEAVAEEIHATVEAKMHRIPVAMFSDIYGCFTRPWSRKCVAGSDILFVTSVQEVELAKEFAPNAKIVHAPNPAWNTYFATEYSREEVRARLGIARGEKMVLVGGAKEMEKNFPLFTDVVVASRAFSNLHLVFTIHPAADHGPGTYSGVVKWSTHPVQFPAKELGFKTLQMIAGADLVVTAGGSTVTIMAACQRVHVVDLMHTLDELWWKELSGLDFWPPARQDVSWLARDERELAMGFQYLLDPKSRNAIEIRDAQETEFYPGCFDAGLDEIVRALAAL